MNTGTSSTVRSMTLQRGLALRHAYENPDARPPIEPMAAQRWERTVPSFSCFKLYPPPRARHLSQKHVYSVILVRKHISRMGCDVRSSWTNYAGQINS